MNRLQPIQDAASCSISKLCVVGDQINERIHALTCCTHFFFVAQFVCAHPHIFMRVQIHAWLECHEKGVFGMSVLVLYLAFSLLLFHQSLLFLHAYLDILAVLTCPKRAGHAQLRTRTRSLAIWPCPPSTQVMSPRSSTRILPWMTTRRSSTIRTTISPTSRKPRTRHTSQSGVLTMFEFSLLHSSHW